MTLYLVAKGKDSSLFTDDPVIRKQDVVIAENFPDMLHHVESKADEQRLAADAALAQALETAKEEAEQNARARHARQFADLEARAANLGREARQQAETLAVAIVRQIAPGFAEDRLVAALAKRAIDSLESDRPVEVHVHPDAAEAVQRRLADQAGRLTIVADEALSPRDCLVIGPHGRVDAGLEAQLAALETAFAERAEEAAADAA
ncbi:MAG: FliH/SctL family protein [Pacificimonas sp.]